MSRYLRKKNIWPSDDLAKMVWHLVAALEDVTDLFEASQSAINDDSALALMKKALVELLSFDELVKELQSAIAAAPNLDDLGRDLLHTALRKYHLAFNPSRKLLTDIRNTLDAHRTGNPDINQKKIFRDDFSAWGAWEQHLVKLEASCASDRWINPINAAIALFNVVKDQLPGNWFTADANRLQLWIPIKLK